MDWLVILGMILLIVIGSIIYAHWEIALGVLILGIVIIVVVSKAIKRHDEKIDAESKRIKSLRIEEERRIQNEKYEESRRVEKKKAEEEKIKKEKEAEFQRRMAYTKRQAVCHEKLNLLWESTLEIFESMPKHLELAEESLNQANTDFIDSAYSPFWDSMERTLLALGSFYECVVKTTDNSIVYAEFSCEYDGASPSFPVSRDAIENIQVYKLITDRMKDIERTAQRNFEFSTIYEQRKTNQILIAGFTNLAQALGSMTSRITNSIINLYKSIDSMNLMLSETMSLTNYKLDKLEGASQKRHEEILKLEYNRKNRERAVIGILESIKKRDTIAGQRPNKSN